MAVATKNRVAAELNGKVKSTKEGAAVKLLKLDVRTIKVKIRGTATLISERMSPDSVDKIRAKQMQESQLPNGAKDPEKCFRDSCYLMPGSSWTDKRPVFGFKAIAFKTAMVEAANDMAMAMTEAKRFFHVVADGGDLVQLGYEELRMREDIVKTPPKTGNADLRYRGEFVGWFCTLTIRYNGSVISAEQVVNILNVAGFGVGVGAMRPKGKQSTGDHGTWEVEISK